MANLVLKGRESWWRRFSELLEAGQAADDILAGYPGLSRAHIRAALHLAARLIAPSRYPGLIVLRIHPPHYEKDSSLALTNVCFNQLPRDKIAGHLLVVRREKGLHLLRLIPLQS